MQNVEEPIRIEQSDSQIQQVSGDPPIGLPLGTSSGTQLAADLLRPLPGLLVAALFWAYHRRIGDHDRTLVGEQARTFAISFGGVDVDWRLHGKRTCSIATCSRARARSVAAVPRTRW